MQERRRKLPFWKVFETFFLSYSVLLLARGVNSQNDETEGTTTEITINRAIEIGKLFRMLKPLFCSHLKLQCGKFLREREKKVLIT